MRFITTAALTSAFAMSTLFSTVQAPSARAAMMLGESLNGCVSYRSGTFTNRCETAANINYCVSGACEGMDGVQFVSVPAGSSRSISLNGRGDANLWYVACDTLPIWSTGANALEC